MTSRKNTDPEAWLADQLAQALAGEPCAPGPGILDPGSVEFEAVQKIAQEYGEMCAARATEGIPMSTQDWLQDALGEFFAQTHRASSRDVDDDRDKRVTATLRILALVADHTVPELLLRRLTQPVLMPGERVEVHVSDERLGGVEKFRGHVISETAAGGPLIVKVT